MAELANTAPMDMGARLRNWREALLSVNLPPDRPIDAVSRWLIMTRAAVLPMTLTSGLIGGLLAGGAAGANWWYFLLGLAGLMIAHASNNLINDYFDLESGIDTSSAPRALYAPHPVLSGWITKSELLRAIVILNLADACILGVLFAVRGWLIVVFALAGLFISVFYVAPPLRLKHRGLGEPGVFIVWGPLMVCGTYFVTTGTLPAWVWVASLPYAILVTTVLIGKHIDKLPYDAGQHVSTLPVILGERVALRLNQGLMISFYVVTVALVLLGVLGFGVLLVLAALPVLWRTVNFYSMAKPAEPPRGYPVWPLWYVGAAFIHTRRAGALFVLGLIINRIAAAL
ncbi:MAG TPA: prenyltransferase [Candidatus Binataceae bacterium]|nr:prenyltransferase [Candidatus Binataceae bacterium]